MAKKRRTNGSVWFANGRKPPPSGDSDHPKLVFPDGLAGRNGGVSLGSVPLGFWMGQQGSIITFVLLIAIYVWRMEKLDESYGIDEEAQLAAKENG